jgi:transcriptional regulator with XRE-family HTH domain
MESLGKKLRSLRKAEGLTLAQLGEKVGLSTSYLSQVERGVTMPSLARLTDIAQALGAQVRYFFENDAASPRVIRANEGRRLKGPPGIDVVLLSAHSLGMNVEPHYVVFHPGACREHTSVLHGEECGLVLRGELTVTVGEETFVLAAGDSIHYHRHQPCSWRNDGTEECVVIWSVSRPVPGAGPQGSSA